MYSFRKNHYFRYTLCIIAVAVFLRSFIAPGFMLKASAEDGLDIIFCNGPVSANVSNDGHSEHHHHGDTNKVKQEVHISPICSQWSTSSQLLSNTIIIPFQFNVKITTVFNQYTPGYIQRFAPTSRITRGPPV